MRRIVTTLALLFLLIPAAHAQEPDTTDAWRYLPFHPGDVWEYEQWEDKNCTPQWPPICEIGPNGFLRREVVRDTTLNSEPAWIVRESSFNTEGLLSSRSEWIVRYDTTAARAFEYRMDGSPWDYWPDGFPCRLDASVDDDADCGGPGYVELDTWPVFDEPVAVKRYVSLLGTHHFVADIGLISTSGGEFIEAGKDIVYARVEGEEYGTRIPVASESAPEVLAPFGLAAHPNPLRDGGTLTLRLDRPERVRVEAFDALGRRVALVHDGVLPAGAHRLPLDVSGLAPGLYLVRVATGSATTAIRVTVAR